MQASLADFEQAIRDEGPKFYLIKMALLVVAYVVTAQIGLSLAFSVESATTVWPPTGIAIAAVLIWGYHYLPGVFAGALLANVINGASALLATSIATGNTLEAVVAVLLIRRFIPAGQILEKIANVMRFLLLGPLFATMISATIGAGSLVLANVISRDQFASTWLVWWVGDMMGALIIVLLILAWRNARYRAFIANNLFETIFVLVIVATAGFIIFSQPAHTSHVTSLLIYLLFPLIIWASVRLTQIGAVSAGAIIAVSAIWGTLARRGPYALDDSIEDNLIFLHLFIFVVVVTGLTLAVAVSGRLRSEEALNQKANELDAARQKVMQNVRWRKELETQVEDATNQINGILGNIFEERKRK